MDIRNEDISAMSRLRPNSEFKLSNGEYYMWLHMDESELDDVCPLPYANGRTYRECCSVYFVERTQEYFIQARVKVEPYRINRMSEDEFQSWRDLFTDRGHWTFAEANMYRSEEEECQN